MNFRRSTFAVATVAAFASTHCGSDDDAGLSNGGTGGVTTTGGFGGTVNSNSGGRAGGTASSGGRAGGTGSGGSNSGGSNSGGSNSGGSNSGGASSGGTAGATGTGGALDAGADTGTGDDASSGTGGTSGTGGASSGGATGTGGADGGTDEDGGTPSIVINEVESEGNGGDWVEFFNNGVDPVNVSGWTILDSDNNHTPYAIPANTIVAPGGFLTVSEAALGFGLGARDNVRLFVRRRLVASFGWTDHAATTYGRCPDGASTDLVETVSPTKNTANACSAPTDSGTD